MITQDIVDKDLALKEMVRQLQVYLETLVTEVEQVKARIDLVQDWLEKDNPPLDVKLEARKRELEKDLAEVERNFGRL